MATKVIDVEDPDFTPFTGHAFYNRFALRYFSSAIDNTFQRRAEVGQGLACFVYRYVVLGQHDMKG
jgi:hypothetical protein